MLEYLKLVYYVRLLPRLLILTLYPIKIRSLTGTIVQDEDRHGLCQDP